MREVGRSERERVHGDHDAAGEEGGQETEGPPGVEPAKARRTDLCSLREEQGGDEEPAQHEEHVDAQESPSGEPQLGVVGHHAEDGEAPDTVQGRPVSDPARWVVRVAVPCRRCAARGAVPIGAVGAARDESGGVTSLPRLQKKMFSPDASATWPWASRRIASS